ncbi:MAG: NAD+ synthase [Candidatus Melainabacteria bacterium HGW-Melainabacteria-1]|nr:MAG: NAD+ synthase [Candidatus Melainabacteria bacterium HGW-Melainabacteria-1]
MKIALAQINTTVGALKQNTSKIIAGIEQARSTGAELVLFPELSITGYPPLDLLDSDSFIDKNLACLQEIIATTAGITAIVGFVDRNRTRQGKHLYNAVAVIRDCAVISTHYKMLLPTYDVFDEDRYFEPADQVFPVEINGLRVGVTICEDLWNDSDFWSRRLYLRDPAAELHAQGIELLLCISASPFHVGKPQLRLEMLQALSRKYQVASIYLNLVGGNDSLIFDGHSFAVDAHGEPAWFGEGFVEQFSLIDLERLSPAPTTFAPDMGMIENALALGIRDYLAKTGFKSVVLGLSGGIDSAITAALAVKALGAANVLGVAMPSQYSSEGSVSDAYALAENLGIRCETIPIRDIFDGFKQALSPIFADIPEDVTEENLQARIRGNLLMALSNKYGHLLLTTGNKSEMAVGYCTLYGDMCGGLGVIADLPKTWVYQLAEYLNRDQEVIPRNTITKPPSAELRPDQTDQDSLPPYEILDGILTAYIEEHRSAEEIIGLGHAAETVHWVLKRINLNEYKRRQAPPGLKVTRKAFGQGRRFPIARGYD